jgi:hypothetical protein
MAKLKSSLRTFYGYGIFVSQMTIGIELVEKELLTRPQYCSSNKR